jgi:hypothetical protein
MSKPRTFVNAEGETKPMIWDPGLLEEQRALIASFLRDMEPEQLEKDLADMPEYARNGVRRFL